MGRDKISSGGSHFRTGSKYIRPGGRSSIPAQFQGRTPRNMLPAEKRGGEPTIILMESSPLPDPQPPGDEFCMVRENDDPLTVLMVGGELPDASLLMPIGQGPAARLRALAGGNTGRGR